jgi:hypothetical protein
MPSGKIELISALKNSKPSKNDEQKTIKTIKLKKLIILPTQQILSMLNAQT